METCQFSETQFSFCFTFEFIDKFSDKKTNPIFLSTFKEGKEKGGFDVNIDGNIFFQYKIPKYYESLQTKNSKHWSVFNHDYYRIKIETNKTQFDLLKKLKLVDINNNVYYATPGFHIEDDFKKHYCGKKIIDKSCIFDITEFPKYNSGHHNLIYSPTEDKAMLFSDPISIKKLDQSLLNNFTKPQKEKLTIIKQALKIREILVEIDNNDFLVKLNDNQQSKFIEGIHSYLSVMYNIHWFPIKNNH